MTPSLAIFAQLGAHLPSRGAGLISQLIPRFGDSAANVSERQPPAMAGRSRRLGDPTTLG